MALTSYSGNPVPLDYLDPEQLFGRQDAYPGDVGYFGDPFLGGPFELEDYSCSNDSPSSHCNYILASDGLECLYPKRQRTEGPVLFPELPPLLVKAPAAEFLPFPNECCCYSGGCENEYRGIDAKKMSVARPSQSTQSMAARDRRRKITEKTTELGRLIPGGRKMTTAEMLQAAHKYVRFLQAQVGLLQLVQPNEKVNSIKLFPFFENDYEPLTWLVKNPGEGGSSAIPSASHWDTPRVPEDSGEVVQRGEVPGDKAARTIDHDEQ